MNKEELIEELKKFKIALDVEFEAIGFKLYQLESKLDSLIEQKEPKDRTEQESRTKATLMQEDEKIKQRAKDKLMSEADKYVVDELRKR